MKLKTTATAATVAVFATACSAAHHDAGTSGGAATRTLGGPRTGLRLTVPASWDAADPATPEAHIRAVIAANWSAADVAEVVRAVRDQAAIYAADPATRRTTGVGTNVLSYCQPAQPGRHLTTPGEMREQLLAEQATHIVISQQHADGQPAILATFDKAATGPHRNVPGAGLQYRVMSGTRLCYITLSRARGADGQPLVTIANSLRLDLG